jgi:hypothetical protein
MLRVVALPCHDLQVYFIFKFCNKKGKKKQILEKVEVTHQETKKCQSHATYFTSHLVPHHLQHYTTLLVA